MFTRWCGFAMARPWIGPDARQGHTGCITESFMRTTTTHDRAPRYHLIPVEHEWGVQREGGRVYECIHGDRQVALREAKRIAHEKKAVLVLHDQGGRAGASIDFSVESSTNLTRPGGARIRIYMSDDLALDLATD
jgi:hypothetical protein